MKIAFRPPPAIAPNCLGNRAVAVAPRSVWYRLTVAFIKVVRTQIRIGLSAREQMIGDYQDRMAYRHLSFLLAAPSTDAVILGAQILILGVRGPVRGFHQAVAQPRTTFAGTAAATFTCRFVVPRAHAGPRGQMPGASKATHVPAGFGPEHLCRAPAHSGNRVEPSDLLLKRTQSLLDLLAESFDGSFQIIDLRQMLGDQKTLMRFKPPR